MQQASGATLKEALTKEVDHMLADPKAGRMIKNFTEQWLKLREIDDTTPDNKLYSDFDEVLQVSMADEAHGFFRELIVKNLPITNLINSDFIVANRRLARHYGLPEVEGFPVRRVTLPKDSVRGGVLTQAAVLKVTANGTNTSPVNRGVWVLENILGKHIPPPPPTINGIEPDIRAATTIRERRSFPPTSASSYSACRIHRLVAINIPLGFHPPYFFQRAQASSINRVPTSGSQIISVITIRSFPAPATGVLTVDTVRPSPFSPRPPPRRTRVQELDIAGPSDRIESRQRDALRLPINRRT